MYYRYAPLRFECTRCGACCTGTASSTVMLADGEAERIRRHLSLSTAWFRRRYIERAESGDALRLDDGRCPFLGAHGGCRIYPVRPRQCRSYPFWPELVATQTAWRREARRCEGIGRGAVVPVAHIERMLRLDQE
jgi:Fe-S-cluster containining protein